MNNKERSEKIRRNIVDIFDMESGRIESIDIRKEDIEWLIEQAWRVQELEEDLLELVKQNKELRKSIAFYSSESYNAHLERLLDRSEKQIKRYHEALKNIYDLAEYDEYDNTLEQIVSEIEKALEGEE